MKKLILLFFLSGSFFTVSSFANISEELTPSFLNDKRAIRILDQCISSYVRTSLAVDKKLAPYRMKVNTEERIVILSGRVERDSEASDAIEIAAATPGVTQVDASMLSVRKSKTSLNDLAITANINGAYTREKLWGNDDFTVATIDVKNRNGIVYLSGNATDHAQRDTKIKLSEAIPGVIWVYSSIKIN